MTKEFQYFSYLKLDSSVVTSCTKTDAVPEYSPQLGNYDITGVYFQALHHIIAPAAPMVRQQSSLINTPEWEYSS